MWWRHQTIHTGFLPIGNLDYSWGDNPTWTKRWAEETNDWKPLTSHQKKKASVWLQEGKGNKKKISMKIHCRKRDSFLDPRVGSCLILGDEFYKETHILTKQKTLLGRGVWGREQQSKRTQEDCCATWLEVSGFMVTGLISRLSLGQSACLAHIWWLGVLPLSLSQDGFHWEGFWEVRAGHIVSSLVLFPPPKFS